MCGNPARDTNSQPLPAPAELAIRLGHSVLQICSRWSINGGNEALFLRSPEITWRRAMQRNVMLKEGKPYDATLMWASRPVLKHVGIRTDTGDAHPSRRAGHRRVGLPKQVVAVSCGWVGPASAPLSHNGNQNGIRKGKDCSAMNCPSATIPAVKLWDPIADILMDRATGRPTRPAFRAAACSLPIISSGVSGLPLGDTRTENRSTGCDHG